MYFSSLHFINLPQCISFENEKGWSETFSDQRARKEDFHSTRNKAMGNFRRTLTRLEFRIVFSEHSAPSYVSLFCWFVLRVWLPWTERVADCDLHMHRTEIKKYLEKYLSHANGAQNIKKKCNNLTLNESLFTVHIHNTFYFLLSMHGRKSVVLGRNFQNWVLPGIMWFRFLNPKNTFLVNGTLLK